MALFSVVSIIGCSAAGCLLDLDPTSAHTDHALTCENVLNVTVFMQWFGAVVSGLQALMNGVGSGVTWV